MDEIRVFMRYVFFFLYFLNESQVVFASGLPVAIFPSAAAGPSGMTLLTWRNSSGSSPPIIVKPKPMLLFWRDVDKKLPFSCVGSRVNSGFSGEDT